MWYFQSSSGVPGRPPSSPSGPHSASATHGHRKSRGSGGGDVGAGGRGGVADCGDHSLNVYSSDTSGTLLCLFSLADLIFIISVHPSYWLVRGKLPVNTSNLGSVVACNQLNIHRYKCLVYSGENALYFFQRWSRGICHLQGSQSCGRGSL